MSDPIGNILSITWWRNLFQKTGKAFGWGCAVVFGLPLVIGFGWNQFSGRGSGSNTGAANRDAPLMTVNGDPVTMGDYYQLSQNAQSAAPGEAFARQSGQIIDALVRQTVIAQEAKRENVKASDAEIDKTIHEQAVQVLGKNATDAEFESKLAARGMSLSSYREELGKMMLGQALVDNAKKNTVVTEEDARNQSAEVQLTVVLIPTAPAPGSPFPQNDPRAKPDAEAKKYAEALLEKVKSGKAKIADVAKANSSDYHSKQGGDTGYMPEYKSNGMPGVLGILGYGKDVDEAVHKAKPGDYVGVIKATGFQTGYFFARLVDRKITLPKDFVANKAVDSLKAERAQEAILKKIEDLKKVAKVVIASDRVEQKAYYDYFLASQMAESSSPFSGQTNPATPEETNKQWALANTEIAALYKKDPTNTTAAVLTLDSIQKKIGDPKTPPTEQTALREQLLPLYQNIIKVTEGDKYVYRFGLADALRDKKQFAEAYKNYHAISKSLDLDTPTDLKMMQDAQAEHNQLAAALKTIASPEVPDAAKEAEEQLTKAQVLTVQISQLQQQQAMERKAQQDAQKKQAEEAKKAAEKLKSQKPPTTGSTSAPGAPGTTGQPINLVPGSSRSITLPPAGGTPATAPTPSTSGTPTPSGGPKSTTPPGGAGR